MEAMALIEIDGLPTKNGDFLWLHQFIMLRDLTAEHVQRSTKFLLLVEGREHHDPIILLVSQSARQSCLVVNYVGSY